MDWESTQRVLADRHVFHRGTGVLDGKGKGVTGKGKGVTNLRMAFGEGTSCLKPMIATEVRKPPLTAGVCHINPVPPLRLACDAYQRFLTHLSGVVVVGPARV